VVDSLYNIVINTQVVLTLIIMILLAFYESQNQGINFSPLRKKMTTLLLEQKWHHSE
jgi:hypothetical protein